MPFKVVRTEAVTPEDLEKFQQDEEDYEWLSAHAQEIETRCKGKFIAVVNHQLFVGESWEEVQSQAKAAFPDRDPIVEYIPWKRQVKAL
ncbi:MAG: hypothetical protein HY268_17670 [Deltaproteobacteria bacterium]|nr:hypothetical protein [Deltaproteobacteria bacterium]